jgi:hypothetical protein
MPTTCPCGAVIDIDDINIKEGVALCRRCGKLSRLADLAGDGGVGGNDRPSPSNKDQAEERKAVALAQGDPPSGCAVRDYGDRVTLHASARSLPGAAGLAFFAIFWNGIVSVFLVVVFSSFMAHLGVTLPAWFPTPISTSGGSGGSGGSGSNMPLGMTIFMALFLTPFVLIGLTVVGALLTTLMGRVEVRLRGPEGAVFTGVGPFGWKRRFEADAVEAIRLTDADIEEDGRKKRAIAIETATKTLKFASLLPDQRRLWLGGALKTMLLPLPGR